MPKISGEELVLFSFYLSSCAWRVRIALNLKKIKYQIRSINIDVPYTEAQIKELKAINPMMQVPALIIDGHTLIESVAIMHYLDESRPKVPLLPKDPFKRAKVREIVEVICAGIQPLQNPSVLKKLDPATKLSWAQNYISRGFNAIEKLVAVSSGKFCVGDDITMADCCLVPQVYNASSRFEMDLTPYPNILRINKTLESHEAFKLAHPNAQPDYPNKLSNENT